MNTLCDAEMLGVISCLECLCEAYGVTVNSRGLPLEEGYRGGFYCCYDQTHCAVKEDAALPARKLFVKLTVTWVDMDETVIPVRNYKIDGSDTRTSLDEKPICEVSSPWTICLCGILRCPIHICVCLSFVFLQTLCVGKGALSFSFNSWDNCC